MAPEAGGEGCCAAAELRWEKLIGEADLGLSRQLRRQWCSAAPIVALVDLGQSNGKHGEEDEGEGCDGENGEVTAPVLFIDRVG